MAPQLAWFPGPFIAVVRQHRQLVLCWLGAWGHGLVVTMAGGLGSGVGWDEGRRLELDGWRRGKVFGLVVGLVHYLRKHARQKGEDLGR